MTRIFYQILSVCFLAMAVYVLLTDGGTTDFWGCLVISTIYGTASMRQ